MKTALVMAGAIVAGLVLSLWLSLSTGWVVLLCALCVLAAVAVEFFRGAGYVIEREVQRAGVRVGSIRFEGQGNDLIEKVIDKPQFAGVIIGGAEVVARTRGRGPFRRIVYMDARTVRR